MEWGEFPGNPVVRTWRFLLQDPVSIPGGGGGQLIRSHKLHGSAKKKNKVTSKSLEILIFEWRLVSFLVPFGY